MPLSAIAVRNAKPGEKPYKLHDTHGLYLLVAPSGGRWWRLDYRFDAKRKTLSMGVHPEVGLAEARKRRDEARRLLSNGIDPSAKRKAEAASLAGADSFEAVTREWYAKHAPTWAPAHSERIIRRFERDIFPWIGGRPLALITAAELLAVIRRIEARGAVDTAHRALQSCGQIFRYGVATGRADRDVAADLRGALPPAKKEHMAAITDPGEAAALLRMIDGYRGTFVVRCALRLAPLLFVRPGELRMAEWADFDIDAAQWRFTLSKTGTPHIVPLSRQAVAILRELHPLTGGGRYVFPSAKSNPRPMSNNAVLSAFRRMGIEQDEMSGHGFRAMARTILDEVLGFRPDLIEAQLGHQVRDPNGRAYNRTAFIEERTRMMQVWADYLDRLRGSLSMGPSDITKHLGRRRGYRGSI